MIMLSLFLSFSPVLYRIVSYRSYRSYRSSRARSKTTTAHSLARSLENGRRVDGRSSACFHLIKADGKVEDVSYLKCVQGLFPGERVEEEADAADN